MTDQLATETPPADPAVLSAADPAGTEPSPQPEPQPEPAQRTVPVETFMREVTPLRAKVRDLELRGEEDRRRLAEAQELITRLQRTGTEPNAQPPAPTPRQPEQQFTQADIDRRAAELNFQRDAQHVIAAGRTAYGGDWESSVSLLSSFGLDTPDFISSIMDVAGRDKTHDVVRAITVDSSIVAGLSSMSPVRRIAEITRIAERMNAKPAAAAAPAAPAAPPAKTVSKAPPPAPAVVPSAGKAIDWNSADQDKMSDDEWSRNWEERRKSRAGARR